MIPRIRRRADITTSRAQVREDHSSCDSISSSSSGGRQARVAPMMRLRPRQLSNVNGRVRGNLVVIAALIQLVCLSSSGQAFQSPSLLFLSSPQGQQYFLPTFKTVPTRSSQHQLGRTSSLLSLATASGAASSTLTKEAINNNNNTIINISNSNKLSPGGSNSNSNTQQVLKRFKTVRDVETAIVRLGRKGRTDEALKLYHAVWALDGLRHERKQLELKRQKEEAKQKQKDNEMKASGEGNENELSNESDKSELGSWPSSSLSPSLLRFITSKSKLRPTTRLMNSAIDACARSSPPARQSEAFHIFQTATSPKNDDGSKKPGGALSPNVFTFGSLLASCARNGDVETSTKLLKVLEKGEEFPDVALNEVIYSTVISACERAEVVDVELALRVLNRGISTLNGNNNDSSSNKKARAKTKGTMGVVGYNAAISAMARATEWKMAVQLLGEMILHSRSYSSPSSSSTELSNPSRSNPNYTPLESIREGIMRKEEGNDENDNDANGGNTNMQSRPAPLLSAVKEGVVVPKPDEVTFGTVLAACERSGEWDELLNVAKAAPEYGVRLDGMALTSVLHACQQLGLADEALEYLEQMKHLGDDDNEAEHHKTNGLQRKGARQPLRGPDNVAYCLAISACARAPGGDRWRDGIRILDEMRHVASNSNKTDCAPDVVAYTAAIAGCSEVGEYTEAMHLISKMRGEGIKPNVVTFSAVINACASASAKAAMRMRREDEMLEYGTGYGSSSDHTTLEDVKIPMNRALRLLQAMKSPNSGVAPNIVTYNAAIRACAEGLNLEGAFDLLRQLKEDGLEPTIVTYGSLMTACERVGDIEAASKVFRMVKQEEEERKEAGGDTKHGDDELQVNEIIYGAAISCCRKARQPERALLLLRKMISEELSPNTATFNTVIAALSEGKADSKTTKNDLLWEKALAVYKVMKSKHSPPGVAPNRQTYNILVRCFSANLQPAYAESMLIGMRQAGYVPDVDLYTLTVRSYEKSGQPMKALRLMEAMREVGYDFYEIKVLDEAFKSGIRILNRVGKGFSAPLEGISDDDEDSTFGFGRRDGILSSNAMSEEIVKFDFDGDDEDGDGGGYQLVDYLK